MNFEEYLKNKKIDAVAFEKAQPLKWKTLKELFEQVHPNSFTAQKKFLINDFRRRYPLSID